MIPAPSDVVRSRSAGSISVSPKNVSPPSASSVVSDRRMTPAVALRDPAEFREVGLALVAGEVRDDRAEVLEIQQREAPRVGPVEDQAQRRLLGVVEPQHLAEQDRTERRHRRADGHSDSTGAERHELARMAGRRPVVADLRDALADPVRRLAGAAQARQVTLDVGHDDGHACGRELLGDDLQRLGLAGAGRPGDETVPVHHRERDPHLRPGVDDTVDAHRAELQGRTVDRVSRGDLLRGAALL